MTSPTPEEREPYRTPASAHDHDSAERATEPAPEPSSNPGADMAAEQATVSPEADPEPSLLDQMGGLTGLVSATLPVLVLIPVNNVWGLGPALVAALGVALAISLWRLARKETLQPAFSGLLGVAICAGIAWFTGDAKGYFLYGIWMSLVLFIVAIVSIILRWPLVGVVWKGLNGEDMGWRTVPRARRSYAYATAGWATVFIARFAVQRALYDADATTTLGIVRILMGWPLTGIVTLLTIWMVRRANAAVEEAQGSDTTSQGGDNSKEKIHDRD